jgi:hypothetical protein
LTFHHRSTLENICSNRTRSVPACCKLSLGGAQADRHDERYDSQHYRRVDRHGSRLRRRSIEAESDSGSGR